MNNNDAFTFYGMLATIVALAAVWLAVSWFLQQWWSVPLLLALSGAVIVAIFAWAKQQLS